MKLPDEAPAALGHEFIALSTDVTVAILTILTAGWRRAKAYRDVNTQAGEVPVTERLRDGMRQALKLDGYPWAKMLLVLPGTEARSREALVPDGRTDIPLVWLEIFLRHGEHDPHAIVECKRIAGSDTSLCREYVIEGIDRFRSGKYGFNHAVGFMVGYLLCGTDAEAVAGINGYLNRQGRTDEELRSSGSAAATWASRHGRASSSAISLHHMFFELATVM